jgi:hypothetical protein
MASTPCAWAGEMGPARLVIMCRDPRKNAMTSRSGPGHGASGHPRHEENQLTVTHLAWHKRPGGPQGGARPL